MQPEKINNDQEVRNWVVNNNPYDQVRFKYLRKLNIPPPPITPQTQTPTQKDEFSIDIWTPKTNDQIRQRYIQKLGIRKVQPTKECQYVFIFDWDDTLLPTTYLNSLKFKVNETAKELLQKLDVHVIKLLNTMLQSKKEPDLIIITNGTKGWVQSSSSLYLPKTNQYLSQNKIPIISARNMFCEQYPDEYEKWKLQTFKTLPRDYKIKRNILTNMVCIGDSHLQIEAANSLSRQFEKIVLKTVKLRENPRPTELMKQIQLLTSKIIDIIGSVKNLTIKMEKK